MVKNKKISFQEMCETIVKAKILKKKDGTYPNVDEIFKYSPTGELFMVFYWYNIAVKMLKPINDLKKKLRNSNDNRR